jgi:sensor histidine kinase YesM
VYESLEPVTILLKGECDQGFLVLTILNNYDPVLVPKKGNGIGLKNISSRLKLIYGMDGLISTSGNNGTFQVVLKIPVK